jgi:NAD(P)-dependent dehydrogenase (short-subunit alcohol dehydrogenase family)
MTTGPTPRGDGHSGKVALVTGANKGIGKEIARQLGGLGMTVLLGARDTERGQKAAEELRAGGADVRYLHLDVTDEATVSAAAGRVGEEFGRLDVLVNNAGIATEWGHLPSETSATLVRRAYDVNVFGVIAVTHAMLPLLRRSPAARIVNLSSNLGSLSLHADPEQHGHIGGSGMLLAYCSSKSALNAITLQYANELRGSGILVNAVNPGYCATDLNGHRGILPAAEGAKVPVQAATLGEDGPTGTFFGADGPVPW